MRDEQPESGIRDAAPDAAFDVAPELFGGSATPDGRRVAGDTAR